jgi:AhpC/TSA antioxidant enzyme
MMFNKSVKAKVKTMSHIPAGTILKRRELFTIYSECIRVPDCQQIVHLQFRRFAGCPVCNLHLHSIVQRHSAILAASIREVIVFHTNAEELLEHAGDLPFAVIADPTKRLYAEFGVESRPRALLDPRAWGPILRGVVRSLRASFRGQRVPSLNPDGWRFGLPAEFLIAGDGRVLACKYGSHAYDQWSVDEVLALSGSKTGIDGIGAHRRPSD